MCTFSKASSLPLENTMKYSSRLHLQMIRFAPTLADAFRNMIPSNANGVLKCITFCHFVLNTLLISSIILPSCFAIWQQLATQNFRVTTLGCFLFLSKSSWYRRTKIICAWEGLCGFLPRLAKTCHFYQDPLRAVEPPLQGCMLQFHINSVHFSSKLS